MTSTVKEQYDGALYKYGLKGNQSWVVRLPSKNGVRPEIGIGSLKIMAASLALKERDRCLDLWARGIDPRAERQAAREAKVKRKTFAEVAALTIEKMQAGWKISADGRASTLSHYQLDLGPKCAPIADKMIDAITVDDIESVLKPHWDEREWVAAKLMRLRIEAVFDYAIDEGFRSTTNPASLKRFKYRWPKDRSQNKVTSHASLPWQKIPDFLRRVRAADVVSALVLEFAILTAARSIEARGAKWSEIDLEARTWTVPDERMKKDNEHVVPLSDQAIALLERVKARGVEGDLIFPGNVRKSLGEHHPALITNQAVWALVQRIDPDVDVTTHGFRASFANWGETHDIDKSRVLDLCLAHSGETVDGEKVSKSWKHYAHSTLFDRRRVVMQKWGDYCDGKSADVLPFKQVA